MLLLYIVEPGMYAQGDMDASHLGFARACVEELRPAVEARGGQLAVRVGSALEVLEALHQAHGFVRLWSHEETGNGWSYDRDRAVKRWARKRGVRWSEHRHWGVVRGKRDRKGWAKQRNQFLVAPPIEAPARLVCAVEVHSDAFPSPGTLGLAATTKTDTQPGGERAGRARVNLTAIAHNRLMLLLILTIMLMAAIMLTLTILLMSTIMPMQQQPSVHPWRAHCASSSSSHCANARLRPSLISALLSTPRTRAPPHTSCGAPG